MRHSLKISLVTAVVLLLSPLSASYARAQRQEEPSDSLVRLINAKSARLIQSNGRDLRKIVGPARFLHNNTYLLCDTALWNVDSKVIDAIGNVSIIQEGTVLTSDKMIYYADRDLAEFRGHLVQLCDKDNNTLRTRNLDYNTKDSVAVFFDGGSMRDKDGQIIESIHGTYDSKIKTFTFTEDVNMFTDSIFVKTENLVYESDMDFATFGKGTDMWKDDNMLSSSAGWYDRTQELFFFYHDVHVMTDTQEGWSDSLYFYRNTSNVEMIGNAQVTDTTRNVSALAGRIEYLDSLRKVTLTVSPAVVFEMDEQDGQKDSVFFGADTLIYRTIMYCDIDSLYLVEAEMRLQELSGDPVMAYRQKAAEEAAKAAEEAAKEDPNYHVPQQDTGEETKESEVSETENTESSPEPEPEPEEIHEVVDSTIVEQPDTTKYGFLTALRNVKIYRRNMQIVCDSLEYSDVDSLARFFIDPAIWNEDTQQYCADSLAAVIRNNTMEKMHLMSEAFVHIQEDRTHFDQIRATEMIAYLDSTGALCRFDALGGASGLFFLEENDALATVNKKEAKMLSADFVDGNIQKIRYYETIKSDAYPVVQLSRDELLLKGFRWQPERRPASRDSVTTRSLRQCQRQVYASRPRAKFKQTDLYFPGYMSDVYMQIAVRDSLAKLRRMRRETEETADTASIAIDSLAVSDADTISVKDSLAGAGLDSLAVVDSLAAGIDSLAISDSIATPDAKALRRQQREQEAARRQAARDAKIAAREAKWAEKDRIDAEKAAVKLEKKKVKLRARKRKMLEAIDRQNRKDAAVRDRYLKKFKEKSERKTKKGNKDVHRTDI